MSKIRKGMKFSAEHRANISAAQSGEKHWNFGKEPSAETRAKMSKSAKGRKKTAEHRANISAAQKGKKLSAEHIANIVAGKAAARAAKKRDS